MDTLTLVPVSSYLDIDPDNEEIEMEHLCAYFPTSLLNQLIDFIGQGRKRYAILGCSDVLNNRVHYCNDLSIRAVQIYSILWQKGNGSVFAGIACPACTLASLYPYVYKIMTGVPAKSMLVMLISHSSFKAINFDSSFIEWYQENTSRK